MSAAARIWPRPRPVARSTASQSSESRCSAYSSKPPVLCPTNSWSTTPPDGLVVLKQQGADRLPQRQVAVDPDRQVQVGQTGADATEAAHLLRILEPQQPGLRQRVDRQDLGAVLLRDLERRQHPRVVGAGVLAADHDEVGGVHVVQGHRPLPDADRLGQRHGRRLVAHVGAVGQVVGAEGAGQQLIGERRLVGGLARRVEDRLVRGVETLERLADQRERVGPGDRLVVGRVAPAHHRVHEPALVAEPVVAALLQFGDRVLHEERRLHVLGGGLLRHCLRAVLTELRMVAHPRGGIGPGAALAVEPVDLVELEQRLGRPPVPHRLDAALHRDCDGRRSRRGALGAAYLDVVLVDVGDPGLATRHGSSLLGSAKAPQAGVVRQAVSQGRFGPGGGEPGSLSSPQTDPDAPPLGRRSGSGWQSGRPGRHRRCDATLIRLSHCVYRVATAARDRVAGAAPTE